METAAQAKITIVAHPNSGIAHYSYSLVQGLARLPVEFLRLLWLVVHQRVDLIHFQNPLKYPLLTWWAIVLFRALRKRTVYTAHDVLLHYARGYYRFLMRRVYQSADQMIVHSKANQRELLVIAPKVRAADVIPHGVYDHFCADESLSMGEARERLGLPRDARLLLFFGRIDEREGAAVLVQDLPKLRRLDQSLHILMAGAVKFPKGHLDSLARQGGVAHALTIVDEWIPDDEVGLYFSAADAVVLPYLEGSTSGVIKIAMAFDKPVIASRVGELPEMVEHCHAGLLVDFPLNAHDAARMVDFLARHTSNPPCNSDATGQKYQWSAIAARTAQLYTRLLGK